MKHLFSMVVAIFALLAVFPTVSVSENTAEPVQHARELLRTGDIKMAEKVLTDALITDMNADKFAIRWEMERIRRIRLDYDTSEDELTSECIRKIKNCTKDEVRQWEAEGKFDVMMIDGQKRFFSSSVSNLAKRYPEIRKRFKDYSEKDSFGERILAMALRMKDEAKKGNSPYVAPFRLGAKQTLTPKKEFVMAGETIRVWLPYPRETDCQKDITLISATPEPKAIDAPQSNIRSVYFEADVSDDKQTSFSVQYEFTSYGFYQEVDPAKVKEDLSDPVYIQHISEEEPHIIFTPEIKALAKKIVGDEKNPYIKGKLIYNWICENIVYSYSREYSTLLNIPMYVYEHRYGDCGQLGLLLITMCRSVGVPAAWRSGWECMSGDGRGMHDWAAIYIKPYGWLFADPYMGVWAMHESTLPEKERLFLKDFYYGNLDPWRLEANAQNNAPLKPAKFDFRSETVDFQRGEVESGGRNLYFGEFRRSMRLEKIKDLLEK